MDYISTVKKGDKEYCLGGPYYNIVLNKGNTIGDVLDQIPDFNPDLEQAHYPVLWSGNLFGILFGYLNYHNSKGYYVDLYGSASQDVDIQTSLASDLESLRGLNIEELRTKIHPMILSDTPEANLGNN